MKLGIRRIKWHTPYLSFTHCTSHMDNMAYEENISCSGWQLEEYTRCNFLFKKLIFFKDPWKSVNERSTLYPLYMELSCGRIWYHDMEGRKGELRWATHRPCVCTLSADMDRSEGCIRWAEYRACVCSLIADMDGSEGGIKRVPSPSPIQSHDSPTCLFWSSVSSWFPYCVPADGYCWNWDTGQCGCLFWRPLCWWSHPTPPLSKYPRTLVLFLPCLMSPYQPWHFPPMVLLSIAPCVVHLMSSSTELKWSVNSCECIFFTIMSVSSTYRHHHLGLCGAIARAFCSKDAMYKLHTIGETGEPLAAAWIWR